MNPNDFDKTQSTELSESEKVIEWRNSDYIRRTQAFISACSTRRNFVDKEFYMRIEKWVETIIQYEDSFCGENALQSWKTHCENLIRNIRNVASNPYLDRIINQGARQKFYTYKDNDEEKILSDFSSLLWMLGLSKEPVLFSLEDQKCWKTELINDGQLVLILFLQNSQITYQQITIGVDIDYNKTTIFNASNNKGNIGSIGASDNSQTKQIIEQK